LFKILKWEEKREKAQGIGGYSIGEGEKNMS